MNSRSAKRKRWSGIKNVAVQELNKLTTNCAEFSNDMEDANVFFSELYASMENRQTSLFARYVGLEEEFKEIEDVLKTGKRKKREDSSGSSSEISQSYMEDSRRLLSDTSTSLGGHETTFKASIEKMISAFTKFGDGWKEHLNNFKEQLDQLAEVSGRIRILMDDYSRNI